MVTVTAIKTKTSRLLVAVASAQSSSLDNGCAFVLVAFLWGMERAGVELAVFKL